MTDAPTPAELTDEALHVALQQAQTAALHAQLAYFDLLHLVRTTSGVEPYHGRDEVSLTESPYLLKLAQGLQREGIDFAHPTKHQEVSFKDAMRKVGKWLCEESLEGEEAPLPPPFPPFGPDIETERAQANLHDTAVFLSLNGSALRNHPTPHAWLIAHLLDAIGETLLDLQPREDGAVPAEVDPETYAEGLAMIVYLATQLGLHEVGSDTLATHLQRVEGRWGHLAGHLHVALYKQLIPQKASTEAIRQLTRSGLMQPPVEET